MTIRRTHKRNNQAFTLTELAIVLGIVGIIIGAIWVAAASVYANLRVSQAATETLMIVESFKSLYGGNHNGQAPNGTDITSMAINAALLPANMVQNGNTSYALGPWGGSQVNIYSGSNWNAITIAFWNIDQPTCNRLADAIATGSAFPANGLVWESVNGAYRTLPPYGTDTPFTPSDIAAACANSSGKINVQVTYSVF